MDTLEEIVSCMKCDTPNDPIQRHQTAHRMEIAERFNLKEGERILEIGCGQGDMTAVLASIVGPSGCVHAVDIASPDYGAPFTLKEAMDHLCASPLGRSIHVQFETDVLDDAFHGTYDAVVLTHSLFYFKSSDQLLEVLEKAARLSNKICVAEWDISPLEPGQMAHSLAILIQSIYTQYVDTEGNIQTVFSLEDVVSLLQKAGWGQHSVSKIESPELEDGKWEIQEAEWLLKHTSSLPAEVTPVFFQLEKWLSKAVSSAGPHSCPVFVLTADVKE